MRNRRGTTSGLLTLLPMSLHLVCPSKPTATTFTTLAHPQSSSFPVENDPRPNILILGTNFFGSPLHLFLFPCPNSAFSFDTPRKKHLSRYIPIYTLASFFSRFPLTSFVSPEEKFNYYSAFALFVLRLWKRRKGG